MHWHTRGNCHLVRLMMAARCHKPKKSEAGNLGNLGNRCKGAISGFYYFDRRSAARCIVTMGPMGPMCRFHSIHITY